MRFYRRMLQNILYAHGGNRILLSKNPSYSSRIAALSREFPDAHFIKLVRNPFEALPSMLDSMSIGIHLFCDPLEQYPFTDQYVELMKYYYAYPVKFFRNQPEKCAFIKYENLITHPDEIARDLYEWMGLPLSEAYLTQLQVEAKAEKHYQSQHRYPLEAMGLTEARILNEFKEVFSFYEFDHHDFELPEEVLWLKNYRWKQPWKQTKVRMLHNESRGTLPENPSPA